MHQSNTFLQVAKRLADCLRRNCKKLSNIFQSRLDAESKNGMQHLSSYTTWRTYLKKWMIHPRDVTSMVHMLKGTFLLQGLMNNRLSALVLFIHTETTKALGPAMIGVLSRGLGRKQHDLQSGVAVKGMPYRLLWQGLLSCKLISMPASGIKHLHSTIESPMASKVSTLTYPCLLSGPSIGKTCSLSKK